MRKRVTVVVIGAVLGLGAFAAAQAPPFTAQGDQQVVLVNAVLHLNGVVVRADRAVKKGREVSLEGNVRLTLPPK